MSTKAEREYLGRVASLGCVLCRRMGYGPTPAEVHHRRTGTGAGKRSAYDQVAPLCPEHHRGNAGIHGMGRRAWERHFGVTEISLIEQTTIELIGQNSRN